MFNVKCVTGRVSRLFAIQIGESCGEAKLNQNVRFVLTTFSYINLKRARLEREEAGCEMHRLLGLET